MFSDRAKLIALAIVHVFETSRPFGDYSAVAVLDDGAGVSYGINQFTHKSGSLYTVLNTYLGIGGAVGADEFEAYLPTLRLTTKAAIAKLSNDKTFKDLLKAAGKTPEMQLAQQQVMENSYLLPAIDAAEGSHFELPLSLAVIYDSINHGSYGKIRDLDHVKPAEVITHEEICVQVCVDRSEHTSNESFEKAWISEYVTIRHRWLSSTPRLKKTAYRTAFFLEQIVTKNWNLDLPLDCHGAKLTEKMFPISAADPAVQPTVESSAEHPSEKPLSEDLPEIEPSPTNTTLSATKEGEKLSLEANTFTPQTFQQYIPKITAAKRWLGGFSFLGLSATVGGWFAGLPDWLIFLLGFLTGMSLTLLGVVFIHYKAQLFGLVRMVITNNANPLTNNVELVSARKG
jgi:hypothetical protein